MNEYESRRLENIKRNQALIQNLGLERVDAEQKKIERPAKRRKINVEARPSRASARVASNPTFVKSYNRDAMQRSREAVVLESANGRKGRRRSERTTHAIKQPESTKIERKISPPRDIDEIRRGWSDWKASATAPSRDDNKVFHFESHPNFTPNKSPEEVLREGCFGGSYFRLLYSKSLRVEISEDWRELPSDWITGLKIDQYLTNPEYDPEVNKYKVKCGQSIEEWEASGWINHTYDVRGWFQWYCRFFMGRRCEDDDRQISRWARCVGVNGRWRLALLRKYIKLGVKDVFDDGEEGEDTAEVSPVVHQTCHHWAFEVRQDVLDAFWRNPK